jgi:hypothetical protein
MKKTFQLNPEGKNRERVLEAIKHEVRKYVRRERRRPLPGGVDYWDFVCRFGRSELDAVVVHFATLTAQMDAVAAALGEQFYLEIIACHGHRSARQSSSADVAS